MRASVSLLIEACPHRILRQHRSLLHFVVLDIEKVHLHVRQEGDHLLGVGEVRDLEQVDIDEEIESGEPALHQDGALFLVQRGLILDDLPFATPAILLGIEDHMVASLIVDHKILQLRLVCLGPMQL